MIKKVGMLQRILILFLVFFQVVVFAQNQDSIQLSYAFRKLLLDVNSDVETKISEIKTDFFTKSDEHKTWFWTENTKFFIQTGKLNEAEKTVNEGLNFWTKKKNPTKQAVFYNLRGSIESLRKSYEKAIPAYQKAIELYEQAGNEKSAAYVKNNIANTFFSLTDYESAYKYISEAYLVVKKLNDTLYLPSISGVLAVSEVKLGKFESGKKHADECLHLSQKYGNIIGMIIGNYTLGEYFTEKQNYSVAIQKFEQSLSIANQYQQLFYVMLAKIGVAHAANELKEFDLAYQNGRDAKQISEQLQNKNVRYSILKNLAVASFGLKKTSEAYLYLDEAHLLFRSNADATNRKMINDLLIQYETAKKEKTIVESRLKLQEEMLEGTRLKYLIGILGIVMLAIILSVISQRKIQKQRLKSLELKRKESILNALLEGEEKERARISNELHDGLASTVTGIKIGLENSDESQHESVSKVIQQLKNLHEETRRISHNLMPLQVEKMGLIEAVERFCAENSLSKTKLHVSTSTDFKIKLSENEVRILYRIIQEIIHNCLKHAHAKNCSIQFQSTSNQTVVTIEDDGVGFEPTTVVKNQGLNSIQQRISTIGGIFQLESKPGKGCFISIELNH